MKRVLDVQANLTKCDIKKNLASRDRVFIREGTMMKVSKGKMQERTFYLFNDMLLYGEVKKGVTISFKGVIPCDRLVVLDPANVPSEEPHMIRLLNLVKLKTIDVHCASDADQASWLRDLSRLSLKARKGARLDADSQAAADRVLGMPCVEYGAPSS